MNDQNNELNFRFASSLIKVIALVIALMVITISRYAFIFFAAAMLPTIFAIFFDRNNHKCLSATICSFNLIGVMPYLIRIWQSNSIDYAAKLILADVNTWFIIYGAAFIGQILYTSMPLLIVRFYTARNHVEINKLKKQYKEICDKWGIKLEEDK